MLEQVFKMTLSNEKTIEKNYSRWKYSLQSYDSEQRGRVVSYNKNNIIKMWICKFLNCLNKQYISGCSMQQGTYKVSAWWGIYTCPERRGGFRY